MLALHHWYLTRIKMVFIKSDGANFFQIKHLVEMNTKIKEGTKASKKDTQE